MAGPWRRIMAIGCTHGHLINRALADQVLHFRQQFNPEIRIHLGDLIDTAAFRSGAEGTRDECEPIGPDRNAALEFLEAYEPTHITWGNHDWRLWELSQHPKAIVADAAGRLRKDLEDTAAAMHAQTRPYHIKEGWFDIGGVSWGHGYMFNLYALRDHVEMNWEVRGVPRTVHAHTHIPQDWNGRMGTNRRMASYCVGTLMDIRKATYAHRRKNTMRWGPGLVYGEVNDTDARIFLASGRPWSDEITIPAGVL